MSDITYKKFIPCIYLKNKKAVSGLLKAMVTIMQMNFLSMTFQRMMPPTRKPLT